MQSGELEILKRVGETGMMRKGWKIFLVLIFTCHALFSQQPDDNGLYPVRVNGRWGFIDTAGRIAIQPAYDQVSHFTNGIAFYTLNERYGILNVKGQPLVEVESQQVII